MRNNEISIRAAERGYIVTVRRYLTPTEHVFLSLEDVFDYILLTLEGRCDTFKGDMYGKVEIKREP
jgi:hypothetical protein